MKVTASQPTPCATGPARCEARRRQACSVRGGRQDARRASGRPRLAARNGSGLRLRRFGCGATRRSRHARLAAPSPLRCGRDRSKSPNLAMTSGVEGATIRQTLLADRTRRAPSAAQAEGLLFNARAAGRQPHRAKIKCKGAGSDQSCARVLRFSARASRRASNASSAGDMARNQPRRRKRRRHRRRTGRRRGLVQRLKRT